MILATILSEKGRDVATTAASVTIREVVAELAARKIGALVVVEGVDRVVGIVSERDIVKALARKGGAVLDDPVGTIMTREVVTCADSETVIRVMGRMTRGRFRHLPVVKGGRLDGIVSIGDVVKARIGEVEREADDMRSYIAAVG
jgi:CBS domain-containing protein